MIGLLKLRVFVSPSSLLDVYSKPSYTWGPSLPLATLCVQDWATLQDWANGTKADANEQSRNGVGSILLTHWKPHDSIGQHVNMEPPVMVSWGGWVLDWSPIVGEVKFIPGVVVQLRDGNPYVWGEIKMCASFLKEDFQKMRTDISHICLMALIFGMQMSHPHKSDSSMPNMTSKPTQIPWLGLNVFQL